MEDATVTVGPGQFLQLGVIRKLENYPTLGRDVGWALGPV